VLWRKKEAFSDGISPLSPAANPLSPVANPLSPVANPLSPALNTAVNASKTAVTGASWFQILQAYVEIKVSNEELANAATTYPYCTPTTKEAYYYRTVFCEIFGSHRQAVIPSYWQPKWTADGKEVKGYVDPSARTLDVYSSRTF